MNKSARVAEIMRDLASNCSRKIPSQRLYYMALDRYVLEVVAGEPMVWYN